MAANNSQVYMLVNLIRGRLELYRLLAKAAALKLLALRCGGPVAILM